MHSIELLHSGVRGASRVGVLGLLIAILLATIPPLPAWAQLNFSTPSGNVAGFRDYLNNLQAGGNGSGPIQFLRISDGINSSGVVTVVVIGPDGQPQLTMLTDFGDLHTFNIGFDQISAGGIPYSGAVDVIDVVWLGDDTGNEEVDRTLASWQPAEALRISDWQFSGNDAGMRSADESSPSDDSNPSPALAHKFASKRKNGIGLLYGLRAIERWDRQSFYASGGIVGTTQSSTVADNHVMGPAAGVIWIKTRGRWTARLQGLVSVGFNSGSVEQSNFVGEELFPGATNRLLYAQPTASAHHDSFDEFSPSGELRAEVNYRITENITFAINWSGVSVENALESQDRTRYYLPNFGLVDPGNQRLLVHNFFCGIEVLR
jgi:Putative beta barrel porin-7 (BBP7)